MSDIKPLKVLVLCECSGEVSRAFRELGHDAYSVDIQDCDNPEDKQWHIVGDVVQVLNSFGKYSPSISWDLIILHPPCTALAVSGNAHYGEGQARYKDRLEAVQWTKTLWNKAKSLANHVALENPVSVLHRLARLPKASYVHPYEHGHLEQKKTGFHLHKLPAIVSTDYVHEEMMLLDKKDRQRMHYMSPSKDRAKLRSKTFTGIAKAMAVQWSTHIIKTNGSGQP